jgi:hypothetical protein
MRVAVVVLFTVLLRAFFTLLASSAALDLWSILLLLLLLVLPGRAWLLMLLLRAMVGVRAFAFDGREFLSALVDGSRGALVLLRDCSAYAFKIEGVAKVCALHE